MLSLTWSEDFWGTVCPRRESTMRSSVIPWPGILKIERGHYTRIGKRYSEGWPEDEVAELGHTGTNTQVDTETN